MLHQQFLEHTLRLARTRRGFCAPNPSVGSIIVSDNKVIAEGYHDGPGTPHAEIMALQQVNHPLNNATMYVSLEPCSHWGKTPPCFDAIVKSGIKQVIFAYSDPNPLTKKINIIDAFHQKGITCQQIRHEGIEAFYQSYHYWMLNKRPYVTAKIAQSLDGKIGGANRERVKLTEEPLDKLTHQYRFASDMILTTADTIIQDDPKLNVRFKKNVYHKTIVILDRTLKLSGNEKVFKNAKKVIRFYDKNMKIELMDDEKTTHFPVSSYEDKLELMEVFQVLGELGCHDVWIEAGGTLFTHCLQRKLLNRVLLYIVPSYLGEHTFSAYQSDSLYHFSDKAKVTWQVMDQALVGQFEFN